MLRGWARFTPVAADGTMSYDRDAVTDAFARNLTELRLTAKLTRGELARAAGVTAEAVGHWEGRRRAPSLEAVLRLCGALDVMPGRLFW